MLSDSILRWTRSSTSAATTVFVVLPGTNRVLAVARRPEAKSITPLAPDHLSRPQRVTAPVAAGAPVYWRPSVSAAPICCASVLAVAAGGAARHNRQPTTALAILREDAWDQDSGRIGDLLFAVPGPGGPGSWTLRSRSLDDPVRAAVPDLATLRRDTRDGQVSGPVCLRRLEGDVAGPL